MLDNPPSYGQYAGTAQPVPVQPPVVLQPATNTPASKGFEKFTTVAAFRDVYWIPPFVIQFISKQNSKFDSLTQPSKTSSDRASNLLWIPLNQIYLHRVS